MASKTAKSNTWVWILIILLVGVGIWALLANTNSVDAPTKVESVDEDGSIGFNTPDQPQQNFSVIYSSEFDRTESITESVQALEPDMEQFLDSWIVQDPTDENIYYFMTNSPIEIGEAGLPTLLQMNVYRYDYSEWSWERIYKRQYEAGELGMKGLFENGTMPADIEYAPAFAPIGYDNGKLIILATPSGDYSPGPCWSAYSDMSGESYHSHHALNLEDPYTGLTPYELPEEIMQAAQEELEECVSGM